MKKNKTIRNSILGLTLMVTGLSLGVFSCTNNRSDNEKKQPNVKNENKKIQKEIDKILDNEKRKESKTKEEILKKYENQKTFIIPLLSRSLFFADYINQDAQNNIDMEHTIQWQTWFKEYISFLEEQITYLDQKYNEYSKNPKKIVTFKDVFGMNKEKRELQDIITYFNSTKPWMDVDGKFKLKGYLLHGKPGTGKTFLMKALAGEANAHFINLTPGEFDKKYVGEGKQVLDDIWKEAEEFDKTIIFIDEIDGLANRSSNTATDVSKNIVNDLLDKLDGFKLSNKKVLLMGATNNLEKIDKALIRRFDKELEVSTLNKNEIWNYVRFLAKKYPISLAAYHHLQHLSESNECTEFTQDDWSKLLIIANAKAKTYFEQNKDHNVILSSDTYEAFNLIKKKTVDIKKIESARKEYEVKQKYWNNNNYRQLRDNATE